MCQGCDEYEEYLDLLWSVALPLLIESMKKPIDDSVIYGPNRIPQSLPEVFKR